MDPIIRNALKLSMMGFKRSVITWLLLESIFDANRIICSCSEILSLLVKDLKVQADHQSCDGQGCDRWNIYTGRGTDFCFLSWRWMLWVTGDTSTWQVGVQATPLCFTLTRMPLFCLLGFFFWWWHDVKDICNCTDIAALPSWCFSPLNAPPLVSSLVFLSTVLSFFFNCCSPTCTAHTDWKLGLCVCLSSHVW